MRMSAVLAGIVFVFIALAVIVVAIAGNASAPVTAAAPALVAPPGAGQGLTPQGTVLGGGGQRVGELTVWLTAPAKAPARGQNVIEALVLDASGQPVNDGRVSFDLDMTNMSHGKNVVQATRASDGRYDGAVTFMMPGPWRIIATIERGGKTVGSARFDFNVNLR